MIRRMSHTKTPRCPICHDGVRFVADKRTWHLWHCTQCDHYSVLPPPTPNELRHIYSSETGYGSGRESDLAATDPLPAKSIDAALANFGVARGAFLDVGCGDGRLLYHLRSLGWSVGGTDYSPTYVAKCTEHGLDVRHGDLEQSGLNRGSWDVAHMGDVIEHVVDPVSVLRTVAEYLKPGGMIVLRTPNAASGYSRFSAALANLTRTEWLASEAPWHLNDFTPRSLTLVLRQAGYELVACTSEGRRPFGYSVGSSGYLDDEKKRLKGLAGGPRRQAVLRLAPKLLPVAAWTAGPFCLGRLTDLVMGRGDYLVAFARKTRAPC
jgi:2-polyprenyl-3-methyl-5-hydroxy-6-metoxy-1,4-benzoquinol methylase